MRLHTVEEELFGITPSWTYVWKKNIIHISNTASQKVHVLFTIASSILLNKRILLKKTFVESQFNYCPLIRMFHSRYLNNKIKIVHQKALRIVYFDYKSTLQEPLDKVVSFSEHRRNIQTFAIEIYKHIHGLLPAIMGEVFNINRTLLYNLRTRNEFSRRVPKTVKYGTETIYFS